MARAGPPTIAARVDAAASRLDPRTAWLLLGLAMACASTLILWQGRDLTLAGDELHYYARLVDEGNGLLPYDGLGLEYLLAPHNGHLQAGGKLVYETVFALFGPAYDVLRVIELAGILACAALFFELARRRVGNAAALAAAVLLLSMGAAWEAMLWPFDLHTVYALAFGLGALVALERDGRRADGLACALLVGSVLMIEVGLAFIVAAGVLIAASGERRGRAWVPLIPLALYAAWWGWARTFDQGELQLDNISQLPGAAFDSLTAVVASLTGLYGHVPDVYASLVGPDDLATPLAVIAIAVVVGIALRGRQGVWFWALLGALLTYWAFIGFAERAPDSSRYMLVGTVLLLLLGAEAMRGRRGHGLVAVGLVALFAVSLPASLAKLADGRELQHADALSTGAQYAMLELARERVDDDYKPTSDLSVRVAGPNPFTGLNAGTYFAAAARVGSLSYAIDEVAALPEAYRRGADATLRGALELQFEPVPAPPDPERCVAGGDPLGTEVPPGLVRVSAASDAEVEVRLARFDGLPVLALREVGPGEWAGVRLPRDSVVIPWRVYASGPVFVCPDR